MSALASGSTTVERSEDVQRADWIRLARVGAALLITLVAFIVLRRIIAPPAGLPGMVEIQLAGTRETLVSLLRAADHAALRRALLWDTAFIPLYGAALAFALEWRHLRLSKPDRLVEVERDPLLVYAPWFLLIAVIADLLQNLLLVLTLSLDPLHAPKGTAILATAQIVLGLVSLTFFIAVLLQCLRKMRQTMSALIRSHKNKTS